MLKIKHHEFWNGRLYESPGYIYLAWHCLIRGVGLKTLFKANYGIEFGGASFASEYKIQEHIGLQYFPATQLLKVKNNTQNLNEAQVFAHKHGYPIILKPDYGFTGRGVFKVQNEAQLKVLIPYLKIDYLVQKCVDFTVECGVFYIRHNGKAHISGINQKHFPTVTGDGTSTLQQLLDAHSRHNHFWKSYLAQHDLTQILKKGETKRLSDIGSHTLGCMFTHDPELLTPKLETAVLDIFKNVPGFNYGRMDLLANSLEDFKKGKFTMVEANGIEALPTNVFDPKLNVWQSYRILFTHLKQLAQVAAQNRQQPAQKITLWQFTKQSLVAKKEVEDQQTHLETLPDLTRI